MIKLNSKVKVYFSGYQGECMLEDTDLIALVSWFDYNHEDITDLFVHVVNESKGKVQHRVKLKKKGLRKGFPDTALLKPNGKYHGLFLELKRKCKKASTPVSSDQRRILNALSDQGYFCAVCYGLDEAKKCIKEYLQIK